MPYIYFIHAGSPDDVQSIIVCNILLINTWDTLYNYTIIYDQSDLYPTIEWARLREWLSARKSV